MKPFLESDGGDRDDKNIGIWRSNSQNEQVHIKFDFQITQSSQTDEAISTIHYTGRRQYYNNETKKGLSFSMCKKVGTGRCIITYKLKIGPYWKHSFMNQFLYKKKLKLQSIYALITCQYTLAPAFTMFLKFQSLYALIALQRLKLKLFSYKD